MFGPNHPLAVRPFLVLGKALLEQGRLPEAQTALQHAMVTEADKVSSDCADYATILETYARLLRKIGHRHDASRMETRSRQIRSRLQSPQTIDVHDLAKSLNR